MSGQSTARASFTLMSTQAASGAFSTVYFLLLAHVLPPLEMSSLAVFGLVAGVGTMLAGLGLADTCLQRAPQARAAGRGEEASRLLGAALSVPMAISIGLAVACTLLAEPLSRVFFKSPDQAAWIRIIAWAIPTNKLQETSFQLLTTLQQFKEYSRLTLWNNIGIRVAALLAYWPLGIRGFLGVWALGLLAVGSRAMWLVAREHSFRWFPSGFRDVVRYSLPYYATNIVRFAGIQGDQLLVGVFLRPEALAAYFVARRFADYLVVYIDALFWPLLPRMSQLKEGGRAAVDEVFRRTARFLAYAVVPVCVLVASLSRPLLMVYGGRKYLDAAPVLSLLVLAVIPYALYSLYANAVYILGRPRDRMLEETAYGLLTLAVGMAVLPRLGSVGPALAKAAALLAAMLVARWLLRRYSAARQDRGPWAWITACSAVMAAVVLAGLHVFPSLAAAPLVAAAGGTAFLWLFARRIPAEDLDLIRSSLPSALAPAATVLEVLSGRSSVGRDRPRWR